MNSVLNILSYPFTWGLLVGLIFAAWAVSSLWRAKRDARNKIQEKEEKIKKLETTTNTSSEALVREIEDLRRKLDENQKEITNLRLECQALQQKPGRAELKKLANYEKAVALLQERFLVFAPYWQKALRAAEGDREAREELERLAAPAATTILPAAEPSAQARTALPPAT